MAKLFEVNRTSYYKWKNNPLGQRKKDDLKIGKAIKDIFHTSRETYGSPRIVDKLRKAGIKCGKNRVNRLMKTLGLKAKAAKKYIITTDSNHSLKIAPNLLDRNFKPEIPNIVYTSDLTYVKTEEGWLFLCIIMDLFSRKIIGWSMSDNMEAEMFCEALEMAHKKRNFVEGVIIHSDRGSQYASDLFKTKIEEFKMIQSMSRKGNCWDNAPTESFFHTLKIEEVYNKKYKTKEEAKTDIFDYIEVFYNRSRSHSFLDYKSPLEYEEEYFCGLFEKTA